VHAAAALADPCGALVEGTRIDVSVASVEPLPEAEPGRFDYGAYLRRRGVHVVLSASLADVSIVGRRGGLTGVVDRLRVAGRARLRRGLHPPVREIYEAMVLGDDQSVDDAAIEAFRCSGLLHIMAVSGENVVLLCAIAGAILRACGVGRMARTCACLPLVAVYVVLTGGSPSIVRAGVAGIIALLATLASRPSDGWLLVLLPAAWLMTVNPYAVLDVSFQLSFAAVIGLLFLSRPMTGLLSFLPAAFAEPAAVTTAASIATAPVSIMTFGQTSAIAVPANVAGGFVLGPVMLLGMLSLALGFVWPLLSLPLNLVAGLCVGFLLTVADLCARVPHAVLVWHGLDTASGAAVAVVGRATACWSTCGRIAGAPAWRQRQRSQWSFWRSSSLRPPPLPTPRP
jgi:competence protein ComEC